MSLGTKPIALRSFRSGGARHVFAACDRPAVIYAANKKLLFSNVNDDEVHSSQCVVSRWTPGINLAKLTTGTVLLAQLLPTCPLST